VGRRGRRRRRCGVLGRRCEDVYSSSLRRAYMHTNSLAFPARRDATYPFRPCSYRPKHSSNWTSSSASSPSFLPAFLVPFPTYSSPLRTLHISHFTFHISFLTSTNLTDSDPDSFLSSILFPSSHPVTPPPYMTLQSH